MFDYLGEYVDLPWGYVHYPGEYVTLGSMFNYPGEYVQLPWGVCYPGEYVQLSWRVCSTTLGMEYVHLPWGVFSITLGVFSTTLGSMFNYPGEYVNYLREYFQWWGGCGGALSGSCLSNWSLKLEHTILSKQYLGAF